MAPEGVIAHQKMPSLCELVAHVNDSVSLSHVGSDSLPITPWPPRGKLLKALVELSAHLNNFELRYLSPIAVSAIFAELAREVGEPWRKEHSYKEISPRTRKIIRVEPSLKDVTASDINEAMREILDVYGYALSKELTVAARIRTEQIARALTDEQIVELAIRAIKSTEISVSAARREHRPRMHVGDCAILEDLRTNGISALGLSEPRKPPRI